MATLLFIGQILIQQRFEQFVLLLNLFKLLVAEVESRSVVFHWLSPCHTVVGRLINRSVEARAFFFA